jgi:hypothetical protein
MLGITASVDSPMTSESENDENADGNDDEEEEKRNDIILPEEERERGEVHDERRYQRPPPLEQQIVVEQQSQSQSQSQLQHGTHHRQRHHRIKTEIIPPGWLPRQYTTTLLRWPTIIWNYTDRCADAFPRLYAISCGMIFPLLSLVAMAIVFGYWLAHMESPFEIIYNDQQLAYSAIQTTRLQILSDLTALTPTICLRLYVQQPVSQSSSISTSSPWEVLLNQSSTAALASLSSSSSIELSMEALFQIRLEYLVDTENSYTTLEPYIIDTPNREWNVTDLYQYMKQCGNSVQSGIQNHTAFFTLVVPNGSNTRSDTKDLNFHWNRCTPYEILDQHTYTVSLRPTNQSQYYTQTWEQEASRLYQEYNEYYTMVQNYSVPLASILARNRSRTEASGGSACVVNQFAGGTYVVVGCC